MLLLTLTVRNCSGSLSARRAWIEILDTLVTTHAQKSLSARRAWIEIAVFCDFGDAFLRSLSARRAWIEMVEFWNGTWIVESRSPQGERG